MKTKVLDYLSSRQFFSVDDLAKAAGIKNESAQVLCSRYVKNKTFLRLKKISMFGKKSALLEYIIS